VSLRDQLVAKGIVSKKDARRVDRQLKDERRAEQGSRPRKSATEAEARARAKAEEEARRAAKLAERREIEARREAAELALRVKNLIEGNRLRPGSGQPFWHRSFELTSEGPTLGRHLLRLDVSSGTAWQLRSGEASIAALAVRGGTEYAIVPRKTALVLKEIAPAHLVFHNDEAEGLSDPDLDFLRRQWEPSLAAHRARPEDLARGA
jgi:uncharacterized protein YaiL (DUF2058 family)